MLFRSLNINKQAEVGLIYDPIRQELFSATRGQGAYVNSRRMRVSNIKKLEMGLIGTGLPFRNPEETEQYFTVLKNVFTHCGDIRRAGSAALDLAYVAAGRLDGYWEIGLKLWDIAAGSLMIKEAGGLITDFQGNDNYLNTGYVLAGNMKIHQALRALVC